MLRFCDCVSCHLRSTMGSGGTKGDFHKPFTRWTKNNSNRRVGRNPAVKGLEFGIPQGWRESQSTGLMENTSSSGNSHSFVYSKCEWSTTWNFQKCNVMVSDWNPGTKSERHLHHLPFQPRSLAFISLKNVKTTCRRVSSVRYTGLGSKSTGSWQEVRVQEATSDTIGSMKIVMSWAMGLRWMTCFDIFLVPAWLWEIVEKNPIE